MSYGLGVRGAPPQLASKMRSALRHARHPPGASTPCLFLDAITFVWQHGDRPSDRGVRCARSSLSGV
eukprot:9144436-Pyramimonas_sp.AAC.1